MKKITLCLIVLIATILLGCDQLYEVGVYSREETVTSVENPTFAPGADPTKWVEIKYVNYGNNEETYLDYYHNPQNAAFKNTYALYLSNYLTSIFDTASIPVQHSSDMYIPSDINKFVVYTPLTRTIGDIQESFAKYNKEVAAGINRLEGSLLDDGTLFLTPLPPNPFITIEKVSYVDLNGSTSTNSSFLHARVQELLGSLANGSYSSSTKTYNLSPSIKVKNDIYDEQLSTYNENLSMGEKVIKTSFSNGLLTITEVKEAPTTNVTHVEYIDLDGVYGSRVFSSLSNSDYFTYKYHLQDVIFEILGEKTSIKNVSSNGFVLPDPIATRKPNIEDDVVTYNNSRTVGEKTIDVFLSDNGTLTIIEKKEIARDIVIKSVSITYLDGKTSLEKYNALSSSKKQPYILEMGKYVQAVIAKDCSLSLSSSSFVTTPNISTTNLKLEANAESYNENLRQGKARVSTSFNNNSGTLTIREVELVE